MSTIMPPVLAYMTEVKDVLQRKNVHLNHTSTPEEYVWFMQQGYSPDQAAHALMFSHQVDTQQDDIPKMNKYAQRFFDISVERTGAEMAYKNKLRVLADQLQALQSSCPHEHRSKKNEHISGDYYNRAETSYIVVCDDCGLELGRQTEVHNYY